MTYLAPVRRHSMSLIVLAFSATFAGLPKADAVQILNSCQANFQNDNIRVSELLIQTNDPTSLAIQTVEGKVVHLSADNPFFDRVGDARSHVDKILGVIEKRTAREQTAIDARLTEGLANYGMSFKKKDGTPFNVKVNGIPASVPQVEFDKFVEGMQPVLMKMRSILQTFMSNPEARPEDYGLSHLTREQVQYIIQEMKNSPYFEPLAVNSNLKDYEFGSVYGVDATFGRLTEHLGHIFEINAGTPSGLSNTTMIFEVLRKTDPELFQATIANLAENKVFIQLRETMDAHGKKLVPEGGLSIEIGTGIYNGAHPDIAMISYFSGMPLAERSDLFIDADGYVRLNSKIEIKDGTYTVGNKTFKHAGRPEYAGYPQVTAIYSRSEEGNVLQQDTSGSTPGIGIKIPSLAETNEKLSQQLGLRLNPGVSYAYIRDAKGAITGVNLNSQGQPIVESSWDQFSKDPVLADSGKSLIASVHKKRVYLSNFGTRLIDHKGILSLVTLQVKSEFKAKGLNPNKVVSPPRELRTENERREFFANPRDTVVKVPDESGGVGVHILPTETQKNVDQVVESVRANPGRYVIQKLADFMGVIAPKPKNPDKFGLRAFDGRTFIFMGPDGKAKSDNWALLVRVADDGKLSTNTSQGAQYGWMQIHTKENSASFKAGRNSLPPAQTSVLTSSQKFHLKDYLISIDMTLADYLTEASAKQRSTFLQNFWNSARTMMSVLGPDYAGLIDAIEKVQRGEMDDAKLKAYVSAFKSRLSRDGKLTMPVLKEVSAYRNGK